MLLFVEIYAKIKLLGGDIMLCNRIKQFREYNKLKENILADFLGISIETYKNYESGKEAPNIDIITKLAQCYKVTVDEFYGYTPRLALNSDDNLSYEDDVPLSVLKMSDLSWEEAQLILYYRSAEPDDELINKIIKKNNENN